MTDRQDFEQALDRLLAEESTRPETPSGALLMRVLQDARQHQPTSAPTRPRRHLSLALLLRDLGGWPAMGGLATGAVLGLWIGINPPAALLELYPATADPAYLVDLAPDTLFQFDEGIAL